MLNETELGDQENIMPNNHRNALQRKEIYRNLLSKIEQLELNEDLGIHTARQVSEVLQEINALANDCPIENRVEHADETLLDCVVLSSTSSILRKCIEALDVSSTVYEGADFAKKIMAHCEGEQDFQPTDFLKLLDNARLLIPSVPVCNFVYGSYDLHAVPQPKQKKERPKVQKEQMQKKQPEQIRSLDKSEKSIEEIVKVLFDLLMKEYSRSNEQPIKYYDFVVDTTDFGKTVENMFHCAFLVRDGKVKIDLDKHAVPVLIPMNKRDVKKFREENGTNAQILTAFTYEEWEQYKSPGIVQRSKTGH